MPAKRTLAAVHYAVQLSSPCVGWGGGNPEFGASLGSGPCRSYSADSRTRGQAILSVAGVSGVILFAAVLGIWGTLRSRQTFVVVPGLLMLGEMIPLMFSVWPLALVAGIGLLALAYRG